MKSTKVKKSPAILGLSRKSKDIKPKKKIRNQPLSTTLKNVIAKHLSEDLSEPDPSVIVKVQKNSPRKSLEQVKQERKLKKALKKSPGQSPKQVKNEKKLKKALKKSPGKSPKPKQAKNEKKQNDKGEKKPSVSKTTDGEEVKKETPTQVNYIDSEKILGAVEALLEISKAQTKNKLFKAEGMPVLAQFETIVSPQHPKTTLRLVLPHSPHNRVSDVLLIITDEKKHHRKLRHDDEMYITNFTEKLKELGVTQVTKVMTLRQIRAEYYTYEMRRKLKDMYDIFLVDGKLACKLSSLIGKSFFESRKTPIPVSLDNESKIQLEISRALRKTQIILKSTCCTNSVCLIGNTNMPGKELSENLEAFSKALDICKYPGGWRNIKHVVIKTPISKALPVYYSFVTPKEIGSAELKQTLPKHCVAVKGELSTIGRDVIVRPDGSIEVEGVDDIKSLMHQLYKHAGFKDHQDLDLSNAEYKELVKELQKNIPVKQKREDPNEPTEKDVEDLVPEEGDKASDQSSSSDSEEEEEETKSKGNKIRGARQREEQVAADFEEEEDDGEEEGVEANYMKQWEESWMNRDSEEEVEEEEKKGKKQKAGKNATKKPKDAGNNRKQQGQNAAAAAKRKQKTESAPQGGKKMKPSGSETAKKQTKVGGGKDTQKLVQGGKKGGEKGGKSPRPSKKDTPLRQKGAVNKDAPAAVMKKNKKGKKGGKPAPNYISL